MERLREALKYFGLPQYLPGKEPTPSNCYSWFVHTKSTTTSNGGPADEDKTDGKACTSVDDLAKDMSNKLVLEHADSHRTNKTCLKTDSKKPSGPTPNSLSTQNSRTAQSGLTDGQVLGPAVSDFNFVFEKDLLTGGEEVPLICSGCGIEGHVEKVSKIPGEVVDQNLGRCVPPRFSKIRSPALIFWLETGVSGTVFFFLKFVSQELQI